MERRNHEGGIIQDFLKLRLFQLIKLSSIES